MRVYAFTGKSTFCRCTSIREAVSISKNEAKVFVHVKGIPNPWFVHPVKNGRVQYDVVLKHDAMKKRVARAVAKDRKVGASPLLAAGYEPSTAIFDDPYENLFGEDDNG